MVLYCAVVLGLALPEEVVSEGIHERNHAIRTALDKRGVNAWHFVFPGGRDHEQRKHIAVRFLGVTRDGAEVLLHESPPGLTHPSLRTFASARETASYKALSLEMGGKLMRAQSDKMWKAHLMTFITKGRAGAYVYAFCDSDVLRDGQDVRWVTMELFTAGINYHTQEQYARAVSVVQVDCVTRGFTLTPLPPRVRPNWPDTTWRSTR